MKMSTYIVEVINKSGLFDVFGAGVKKDIEDLGISCVHEVKTAQLYKFCGRIDKKVVRKISGEVLIDKVSQKYYVYAQRRQEKGFWSVDVWYKEGVTDTVAETAVCAINDFGVKDLFTVSTGRKYFIRGDVSKNLLDKICKRILANSLVHEYVITACI